MKKFVAASPDIGSASVRAFRTRDDDKTLAAVKAAKPPFDDDVTAELVAIAYGFPSTMAQPLGADIRKQAKKLVDKLPDAKVFAAAFKGASATRSHEYDTRVRHLDHPLRVRIGRAILFHSWYALSVPFEEDADVRGAILDIAFERAKREDEDIVLLGEIYTEWHGSHGSAASTDLHVLPDELIGELAARRTTHAIRGFSVHGGSLTDLPASLAKGKAWLERLSLDFNPLAELPEVIFELANLETLELAGTMLVDIPKEIAKLKKLRRLDIGNMKKMTAIPESVCALDQLRELRIGNGSIKVIPEAIGGMKSLEVLEMQSTSIRKLPAAIATLPKLAKIEARFSRLDAEKAKAVLPKGATLET